MRFLIRAAAVTAGLSAFAASPAENPGFVARALAAPAAPPSARLPSGLPPEAKADYESGKLLFQDGDYATALIKFEAAHTATKDARLLWNIAVCLKNLRRYARAIDALRLYGESRDPRLSAGDLRDAASLIEALSPFTTELTLDVSEPSAEVFVDDVRIGLSPIAKPFSVDIGNRHLVVQKPGFRVFDKDVPLGGRKAAKIEVKLEREGGRIELRTVPGATISLDGVEIGRGPALSLAVPRGGHLLRIVAPGKRPYQSEVFVDDGKTRSLEVTLDDGDVARAELRVAVGCVTETSVPPENQLTVFLDGVAESAAPGGSRKRLERDKQVIAYVPYPVEPGAHSVRVHVPGCKPLDVAATPTLAKPALITGVLPPSSFFFSGSPIGSPRGWRAGGGVSAATFRVRNASSLVSGGEFDDVTPDVTFYGPSAMGGWQARWFGVTGEAKALFGAIGNPWGANVPGRQIDLAAIANLRLPLYYIALTAGVGIGWRQVGFSPSGGSSVVSTGIAILGRVGIDVKPFCTWGAGVHIDSSSASGGEFNNGGTAGYGLSVFYEPNDICEQRKKGLFKLDASR